MLVQNIQNNLLSFSFKGVFFRNVPDVDHMISECKEFIFLGDTVKPMFSFSITSS